MFMALSLFAITSIPSFAVSVSATMRTVDSTIGTQMDAVGDNYGNYHLAVTDSETNTIQYYKYSGSSWSLPQEITMSTGTSIYGYAKIAVDSNSNPIIGWTEYDPSWTNTHNAMIAYSSTGGPDLTDPAVVMTTDATSDHEPYLDVEFGRGNIPYVAVGDAAYIKIYKGDSDVSTLSLFSLESSEPAGTDVINLEMIIDIDEVLATNDQYHIMMAAPGNGASENNITYIKMSYDEFLTPQWTIPETISGLTTGHEEGPYPQLRSAIDSLGNVSIVVTHDETGDDEIQLAERDNSTGIWDVDIVKTGALGSTLAALTTHGEIEYVSVGDWYQDWGTNLFKKENGDVSLEGYLQIPTSTTEGLYHFTLDTTDPVFSNPHTNSNDEGTQNNFVLATSGTEMAYITAWGIDSGGGDEGEDVPSCTGNSEDGDTYDMSFHAYTDGTTDYDDWNDNEQGGTGLVFDLLNDEGEEAWEMMFDPSYVTPEGDISCATGSAGSNYASGDYDWHLVLLSGLDAKDQVIVDLSMYLNAVDFPATTNLELISQFETWFGTSGQVASFGVDEFDFESYTPLDEDHVQINALTYSGTPNVLGATYTLNPRIDNPADGDKFYPMRGTTVDFGDYEVPGIDITAGTPGSESVPEFKDYILIITIALALGLAYTVIPKNMHTTA